MYILALTPDKGFPSEIWVINETWIKNFNNALILEIKKLSQDKLASGFSLFQGLQATF